MNATALWKAIYTAGHDAASLVQTGGGWRLEGTAAFSKVGVPASVRYALDLDPEWSTRRGSIEGFFGETPVAVQIERTQDRWTLNGIAQESVTGLIDLDFGFTPATNNPQLRRIGLEVGQSTQITVAWMDLGSTVLEPLPQIYRRTGDKAYDYDSPTGPYRATLQIASNGFVRVYPDLWTMVCEGE